MSDPRTLDAQTWTENDSLALEFRLLAAAARDALDCEPTLGVDNMRRQLQAIVAEANAQSAKYAELSVYDEPGRYPVRAVAPAGAPSDVQAVNNLKDRINSLERELWTYARREPSEEALIAAFYAIYGRKGGRPTQRRDGPELVAVEKGLVAAYAVDFGAAAPRGAGPEDRG